MVAWVVLIILWTIPGDAKKGGFEIPWHLDNRTPLLNYRDDGSLHCDENPVFCEPFSFVEEVAGWVE